MWKANGKTTTLQLFLDSLSPKNMRDSSSGDKLKITLFGDLSLEEAMGLSRDRQILLHICIAITGCGGSRDSSVNIVTRLWARRPGNRGSPRSVQTGSGPLSAPCLMVSGGKGTPAVTGVKNVWSCTSIPPNVFMVWCRYNFTIIVLPLLLTAVEPGRANVTALSLLEHNTL
jgi:hypothetical protein